MASFTTLKTDIVDYLDNDTTELSNQLNQIIENAEDQLADDVTEDAFFDKETGSLSIGDNTVNKPAACLLYTSPSPRDGLLSRMPSSA